MIGVMSRRSPTTIRTKVSNQRARDNSLLLLDRLHAFVNLPDDLNVFESFFRQYPEICPVNFCKYDLGKTTQDPVGWRLEFFEVFCVFREMLRAVWERGDNQALAVLLGTDQDAWNIVSRREPASALERILRGFGMSLQNAMLKVPSYYVAVSSKVFPDWRTGAFRYEPETDFRRAVYALFRQSWRAKICHQCNKYFIADKPAQVYCTTKCYGEAKRARDLAFWRDKGSKIRKERAAKERKR